MAKKQEKTKQKTTAKNKAANQNGHKSIQDIALKPLLDALPQKIYQKDKDGRFLFCNQAFLSAINMTAEGVYGKTVYDLYPKERADKFTKEDQQLLKDGQEINLTDEIVDEETGKCRYVRIVKTVTRSPEGEVIGTQGIWWDVTERVNAEIELQTKESRMKTILDSLTMPIVISRVRDGQIMYANEGLSKLVKIPLEDLDGKQTPDFYQDAKDRSRFIEMLQTRGVVKNFDLNLKKSDGEPFWGLLSAKLFEFENEPAIIMTIADITEKKLVTQAFEDALNATETQAHRLSLLNELGAGLNGVTVVDQVYTTTAEHIFHILPCDQASVAVVNPGGDKFDVFMLQEELEAPIQLDMEGTAMAKVMEDQQIFRLPKDAPITDFTDGHIRLEAGLHSFICVPLIAQGESIGVLTVASEQEDGFQDNDIGFMQQIASMLANALQSRRNDEQARLLASIVENHPDFIGVGSLFGQAIYLNPAGREMVGLSPEDDIAQMMATDFYNDEDADLLLNEVIPNALEGGSWFGESNLRRTDGKLIPVEQVINVNYDLDNNPVSFAITMHDITERKLFEEVLQKEQERVQIILESINVPFAVTKVSDGKVIYCNKALGELVGVPHEKLVGQGMPDFYANPSDREAYISQLREQGFVNNFDLHMKRADSQQYWALLSGRLIEFQGEPAIITFALDITERKQAEEVLAQERNLLQTLIDTIPNPIFYKDASGAYQGFNSAFTEYIGLSEAQLLGKTTFDLNTDQALAEKYHQADLALLRGQQQMQEYEAQVKYADGSLRDVMFNKAPYYDPDGGIGGLVGVMVDITERKQAEEALAKRAVELETVAQVGTVASTILDTEHLLQQVVDLTKSRFGLYHAHIYLLNEAGDTLQLAAGAGEAGAKMVEQGWSIPLAQEHSLVAQAARDRQGVIVNDVHETPGFMPNPLLPETCSELAVPLVVGDQVLGVLDVQSDQVNHFSEDDIHIQTTLAAQVAIAIQNARLFTQSEEHAEELALVNKVVAEVSASLDIEQSLQIVADELAKVVDLDGIGIALLNDDKTSLTVVAENYSSEQAASILGYTYPIAGNPVTQKAFSTRNTVLVEDAQNHPLTEPIHAGLRMRGVNTMYVIPMFAGNEIVGTVGFDSKEKDRLMSPQQLRLAETIVYQVATAVQTAHLFTQTEERQTLLRSIIDATPDWIFVKDEEHRYRLANKGYADALHIAPEDFVGKNDLELGFPEELVKGDPEKGIRGFWTDDRLVMDSGEMQVYPDDPATIDGEVHTFHTIKTPLKDAGGQIWGVLAFARDITERHKSQAELAKQASEMSTVAQISTVIAGTLDVQQLLKDVVNITKEKFDLYHAHIYLLNDTKDTLLLKAGSGEVGDMMVAEKQVIPISQKYSSVARAARECKGIVVNNVYEDSNFLPHPALPDTRAELAVPLLAGDELLGVLNIQSDELDHFSDQDLVVETTLASQIAIALVNARTFETSEKSREQLNELTRRLTREGWEDYMDSLTTDLAYSYDLAEVSKEESPDVTEMENLVLPLNIQGETIGQLALAVPDDTVDDASEIVAAIAGSLSAHLENLRLAEQTQIALSETESLYNTSVQLNSSTTLEQILASAFELPSRAGASSGDLYTFGLADNGLPEWAELVAVIGDTPEEKGVRKYVPEFMLANLWLNDPKGAILIGNVAKDPTMSKADKAQFKKEKTRAIAILPLTVGARKIGQIVFRWHKLRDFSIADQRIFNAIATQAASIVYSRLLFRQTDEALSETAALYQGSADLNTANTYEDVLRALRHHTVLGQNSARISINYFNRSWVDDDVPEWVDVVAAWSNIESDENISRYEIRQFPSAKTLMSPTKMTIVEDVKNDERMDEGLRTLFIKHFNAKSAVVIPLVIGGQWAGYLLATYPQKISFPDQEIRRTIALSRQAAVAIENVRLFVQTETQLANLTTIQETTSQLTASRSFNEAVHALLPQLNKAASSELASMYIVKDEMMTLIAAYPLAEQKNVMVPVPLADSPMINRVVVDKKPYSVTVDDPELEAHEKEQLQKEGVSAAVTVPLLTSAGILGVLSVKSTQPSRLFAEQEISLLQTLADQATIAFERMRLLDETSKKAQHEQTLREIAAKVRGSADVDVVLRTAVEEVGKVLGRQAYVYLQDSE